MFINNNSDSLNKPVFAFNSSILLAEWQDGHLASKMACYSNPMDLVWPRLTNSV